VRGQRISQLQVANTAMAHIGQRKRGRNGDGEDGQIEECDDGGSQPQQNQSDVEATDTSDRKIDWNDFAQHKQSDDESCWIAINGTVYDVSK
jgi:cytochrome b involved in lipid metabolism